MLRYYSKQKTKKNKMKEKVYHGLLVYIKHINLFKYLIFTLVKQKKRES